MKKKLLLVLLVISILAPLVSLENESPRLSDMVGLYSAQEYLSTLDLIETFKSKSNRELLAVLYLKGQCHLKLGMFDIAIETFGRVLEILPENYEVLNNIGVAYFQKNDFKNALRFFDRSFLANTNFGVAQTNYNIALEQLSKATGEVVLVPIGDKDTVLNSSGWFYYYLGNTDKAKFYFTEAIAENPKLSENYIAISYVLDDARQFDLSLKYLLLAENLDPDNPNIENNLGVLYYHLGDKSQARAHFDRAIQLNPFFAEPKNNKGLLLVDEGKYNSAATLFEEAVAANNYSNRLLAESLAGLAVCQFCLGDLPTSKETKKRSIALDYKMRDRNHIVHFLQWSSKMIDFWERI